MNNKYMRRLFVMAGFVSALACYASAQIVINEIHYDPDIKTELVEFIELYNSGSSSVDMSGWTLSNAVDFQFNAGTIVAAGGFVVVAGNPTQVQAKFGVVAVGPWTGTLANDGEKVTLKNAAGDTVDTVEYQLGFPWPTVGGAPGYSIELIDPALDNSLGGSWRASAKGTAPQVTNQLVAAGSSWKYFKGLLEPSTPTNAWRDPTFDCSSWSNGPTPLGYDPAVIFGTYLGDVNTNYSTFYLLQNFFVTNPASVATLVLQAMYDDGFNMWINGTNVVSAGMSGVEVPYSGLSSATRESTAYDMFTLSNPQSFLTAGTNVIAVQVANVSLGASSDCFFDARLLALTGSPNQGPTPGSTNMVYATNAPPQARQVNHSPNQPVPGQDVTVSARVSDPDGVASVSLSYQLVDPGSYIELTDAGYTSNWTTVAMNDSGTGGDALPGDGVYTVVLPGALQTNRRLVRYRIAAGDSAGYSISVPYTDDPQPNFAYFVFAGVPEWTGAVSPGATGALGQVFSVASNEMNRLPVIHLIAGQAAVESSTWTNRYAGVRYTGDAYPWLGTLVYDGVVYDHVHYRARGGVWRYAMCKNMWKFDMNRGHYLQMRDNWGKKYKTQWTKLNLGACIQQGDYNHRGEQGMFESAGFRLFELAGVPVPRTTFSQFRVVDRPLEVDAGSQYEGDLWGLYLVVEQEDGRFLDEHDLPDGNFYKMESGTGELNNMGPLGPADKSDLNPFLASYNSATNSSLPDSWWRANLNLPRYYSYQCVIQGIHHYDIAGNKNYFYYLNPETGLWSVHSWDLDLTWADNMYVGGVNGGNEPFKSRVLNDFAFPGARPALGTEFRNRLREFRDLLFNNDEAFRLLDEQAGRLRGSTNNSPSIIDADRSQWDYNPRMTNTTYTSSLGKAGQGRFYKWPNEPTVSKDFNGCVQLMRNYVNYRGGLLDNFAADASIPSTPSISYTGETNYPVNRISFHCSDYSGSNVFRSLQWRIGEITVPAGGSWQYSEPWCYEITAVWQTEEITNFNADVTVPAGILKPGHVYRARVRMIDQAGRAGHWSAALQLTAGAPDNEAGLLDGLRLTEMMFMPPGGSEYEFVELFNTSSNMDLQLDGVTFTAGISYTFPGGSTLASNSYLLVVSTTNLAAFRSYYGLDGSVPIFGPWTGSLANAGEQVTLKTAPGGSDIVSFKYGDGQGWYAAALGGGHSLVPLDRSMPGQATGALDYPGNWRPGNFIGGSPGRAEGPPQPAGVVLNEITAHTDYTNASLPEYDSNDWIEFYNTRDVPAVLTNYYLSDDPANLRKWAVPVTNVVAHGYVVYDEISGFHSPITNGFGIDKAGEQLLLSYLPGNSNDCVVDSVKFKGQENERSTGRYPDGGGFRYPLLRTPGAANTAPLYSVVISEVMYHPYDPSPTNDNTLDEFVELYNSTTNAVTLQEPFGSWRLDGGISFAFPSNTAIQAGACLLVVNFDPVDAGALLAFRSKYNLTNLSIQVLGPYSGKLGNRSDRVALEKPQEPDLPESPDYSWVIVDQVIYGNQDPWPVTANGGGFSLIRASPSSDGNDPASWIAALPTAGCYVSNDCDLDGMPDAWELTYSGTATGMVASADNDNDAFTNYKEYLAGTHPGDETSVFRISEVSPDFATNIVLVWSSVSNRMYDIGRRTNMVTDFSWELISSNIPAMPPFNVYTDAIGDSVSGYYIIRVR